MVVVVVVVVVGGGGRAGVEVVLSDQGLEGMGNSGSATTESRESKAAVIAMHE